MGGDGLESLLGIMRDPVPRDVVAAWALASVVAAGAVLLGWRRRYLHARVGISLLALGGVAGALLWSPLKPGAEYYKHVDEVVANAPAYRDHHTRLQVHGFVVDESILQRKGADEYRFQMANERKGPWVLNARYTGLIPDTFRSGAEIVAKGTLAADGWLEIVPDGIMAKCPSKYDPPTIPSGPRQCVW
jgi:cytochrome c-type biogenesis protein CcmE